MNYTEVELRDLGLRFGRNVTVHRSVEFFGADRITLGSNVRIDCFCVLSAREPMTIGNHVHLGVGSCLFGSDGVEIGDFAGLSNRVSVFTATDDFVLGFLTNPTVSDEFKRVRRGKVCLQPHALIGCGSVVLPGLTLGRGCAVGALSLVNFDVPDFHIVSGNPARQVGTRHRRNLDALEQKFLASQPPAS